GAGMGAGNWATCGCAAVSCAAPGRRSCLLGRLDPHVDNGNTHSVNALRIASSTDRWRLLENCLCRLLVNFARNPYTIQMDGAWMVEMANNVRELRPKAPESEKITLNLGFVDLGHIDLLVQERFYSNRTDFIRAAIRNQLDRHNDVVKQVVARHQLDLGLQRYSRQDLQPVRAPRATL